MKYGKHLLAILFIVIIGIAPTYLLKYEGGFNYLLAFGLVILAYQAVSFIFRSNLNWKDFYTSKFNILTAKQTEYLNFEIDQETLFEKAKEMLAENGYKKLIVDNDRHLILVKEPISFKSWGENIYVTLIDQGNGNSQLIYESVAFQVYTWGKNEDNGKKFLQNMEDSFTI
jgi:hypothetical protein